MPPFAHQLTPSRDSDSAPDWRPAALRVAMQNADDAIAISETAHALGCSIEQAAVLVMAARIYLRRDYLVGKDNPK